MATRIADVRLFASLNLLGTYARHPWASGPTLPWTIHTYFREDAAPLTKIPQGGTHALWVMRPVGLPAKSYPACRSKGPEAEMSGPFDFAEVTFGDPNWLRAGPDHRCRGALPLPMGFFSRDWKRED